MKHCPKCNADKPDSEFNKCSKSKDGLYYTCRACQREYQRQWRVKNPDKQAEYNHRSYDKYRETRIERSKQYYRDHTEACKARSVAWAKAHRKEINAVNRARYKDRKVKRIMAQLGKPTPRQLEREKA